VRSEEISKAVARCLVMAGQHRRLVECRQIEFANWRYRPCPAVAPNKNRTFNRDHLNEFRY